MTRLGRGRGLPLPFLMGVWCLLGPAGCGDPPPPGTDEEIRAALDLPPGARIHRVEMTVTGERLRLLPVRSRAAVGDVIRFSALDHRDHLVRFQEEEMEVAPLEFLRRTGQDRPPPLLGRDATLLLDLRAAPPGRYPFRVESSGLEATGEILLDSR